MGPRPTTRSTPHYNATAPVTMVQTGNNTANTTRRSVAGSRTTTVPVYPTPRPSALADTDDASSGTPGPGTTYAGIPAGQGVTGDTRYSDTPFPNWNAPRGNTSGNQQPTTARPLMQPTTARHPMQTTMPRAPMQPTTDRANEAHKPERHEGDSSPDWLVPVACVLGALVLILLIVVCYIIKRRRNKREASKQKLQMDSLCMAPRPPKAAPRPASTFSHIDIRRPSAEYNYIHPDDIILIGRPRKGDDPLPQAPGEYLALSDADNYAYLPDCAVADINPNTGEIDANTTKVDPTEMVNHMYQNGAEPPVDDVCKDIGKCDGSTIPRTAGQEKPDLMRRQNSYEKFPVGNSGAPF